MSVSWTISSSLKGTASSQGVRGSAVCVQVHKGLLPSGSAPFPRLYLKSNRNQVPHVPPIKSLSTSHDKYGLRGSVFRNLVIKVYCTLGFVSVFHSKEFEATKLASKKFAKALSEAMMKCNYIKPDAKQKTVQNTLWGYSRGLKEGHGLGRVSDKNVKMFLAVPNTDCG